MSALLETRGLNVCIGERCLLRDLNLTVENGQSWAVLGPNGVGKTSLLHTLAGLRRTEQGSIRINGDELTRLTRRRLARQLGVLFQENEDPFPATVMETALIGRHPHLGPWQWESAEDLAHARAALAAVELETLQQREVATLSGGERRRLGIATLLTQDARLMLLDEPGNHLDLHQQIRLLGHLQALCTQRGKALIMVMHELNLAARFASHCLLMYADGSHELGRNHEVLTQVNLERLYQHPLRPVGDPPEAWLPG